MDKRLQRKWTEKLYILVGSDGLPITDYRLIYRTPETPLRIIEQLGITKLHVIELDVRNGRIVEPNQTEEGHS